MKHVKLTILLIPVVLILFLLYANLIKSYDFNYFYDIGSEKDQKTPFITPLDRVSNIENNSRRITSGLTYFKSNIPKGSSSIEVELKFKPTGIDYERVLIGMQNLPEWSYKNSPVYDYNLEKLNGYEMLNSNTYNVYKLSNRTVHFNDARIQSDIKLEKSYSIEDFKDYSSIDIGLRGGHRFYVYLNGTLKLNVTKQDINWYEGEDKLKIEIYDLKGKLIKNITIEDDGHMKPDHNTSIRQNGYMEIENITGAYEIRFSEFDGIIKNIRINTNKIITQKLFLADDDLYIPKSKKPAVFYANSNGNSELSFLTYHNIGKQLIKIKNNTLNLSSLNFQHTINLERGISEIRPNVNDIIVTTNNGYISFSKEMFFSPFYLTDKVNLSSLNEFDYIILPKQEYEGIKREGEWVIGKAVFNLSDAYIKNNQLSLMITIPHLQKYPNDTIQVDWINITVHKNGIFQR